MLPGGKTRSGATRRTFSSPTAARTIPWLNSPLSLAGFRLATTTTWLPVPAHPACSAGRCRPLSAAAGPRPNPRTASSSLSAPLMAPAARTLPSRRSRRANSSMESNALRPGLSFLGLGLRLGLFLAFLGGLGLGLFGLGLHLLWCRCAGKARLLGRVVLVPAGHQRRSEDKQGRPAKKGDVDLPSSQVAMPWCRAVSRHHRPDQMRHRRPGPGRSRMKAPRPGQRLGSAFVLAKSHGLGGHYVFVAARADQLPHRQPGPNGKRNSCPSRPGRFQATQRSCPVL